MALHNEIAFETDICNHLAAQGWLYGAPGTDGDASGYDTPRALYPADLLAWVQATQPQAWDALVKNHGGAAEAMLLDRLRKALDDRGTLEVLRVGIDLLGLKSPLKLAQFKPALAMNPDLQARYAANRLRVVRQCRTGHDDVIDLVLFLNGIPVATAELKTDFTQDMNAAVDQYRFDRIPKPKGRPFAEPLLDFPRGALVHFAVSNRTVMMATRLQGPTTRFLPFNQGDHGGAGNPPNPAGHRTAYLWEQVWQRDSWLEILGRYLVTQRDSKKKVTGFIFPRYHQLDATRKLQAAVLAEGAGHKYLIQHSAGSGKTNSIAWTAHFLADLHDAGNHKLFDSVLVVSDRNVLDAQLQEAIFDFERTKGVVATIKGEGGSKSGELAEALGGCKKIVVCTIQTFPFALKAVQELAATQGKRFAVIPDCKNPKLLMQEKLRNVTSGDNVFVERKGKDGISKKLNIKLIVGSNFYPRITGARADMSRLVLLEVEASKKKDDPQWEHRLREELPAFLNACRESYAKLCPHHGKLPLDDAMRALVSEQAESYEEEFEHAFNAWFTLTRDPADKAPSGPIFKRATARGPLDMGWSQEKYEAFKSYLQRMGVTLIKTGGRRFFVGVKGKLHEEGAGPQLRAITGAK